MAASLRIHADPSLFRAPQHLTNESVKSSMVEMLKEQEPCTCNPCACDIESHQQLLAIEPKLKVCKTCSKHPCPCDSPTEDQDEDVDASQPCPCGDMCDCDPQDVEPCGCNPCECEPQQEYLPCTCDPCECEPPPCTCDPCECDDDVPERCDDEVHVRTDIVDPPPIDYFKLFFDKLQTNIDDWKKELCAKKPKQYHLTGNLIRSLLIEDRKGKQSCFLPGNLMYPSLLKHRITDDDTCDIYNVLLENRKIENLNLAYNRIRNNGLVKLSSAIRVCGNISHLNLMHNNFTGRGIVSLVQALQHRAPLQTLRLTGVKFGNDGIDALACLILSGRSPLNLDIGECDLTVEGFQTFCTALHALDHDINYPNFLLDRKLPFDLTRLKELKEEYNTEVGHLARMGEKVTANRLLSKKLKKKGFSNWNSYGDGLEQEDDYDEIPVKFQEFSTTVLQGLFDLRHRLSETEHATVFTQPINPTEWSELHVSPSLQYSSQVVQKSVELAKELKSLGSMTEFIDEFKHQQQKKYDENQDFHSIPIVSPSFYKLDIDEDEVLEAEFAREIDNPDRYKKSEDAKTKMRIYHGQVIDFNESILKTTIDEAEVCDEFHANEAARFATQDFIKQAAETVGGTDEITEKSNVIQLLMMTLVDMVQYAQGNNVLNEETDVKECTELVESAIEKLESFLMPQIPEKCVTLQQSDIRTFARSLVETASRTFLGLIRNDQICKVLAQAGSIACRDRDLRERQRNELGTNIGNGIMTEDEIRQIAIHFLNGSIEEAARLVGTGDPFGFRGKHNRIDSSMRRKEEAMSHAQQIYDTEAGIYDTVENLIELSGQLAGTVKEDAQKVNKVENLYKTAAEKFIESLLEDVRETLGQHYKTDAKYAAGDYKKPKFALTNLQYRYVSRPTKLVLNRPFFPHYEELMGAKLGDYLKDNQTLKALHIQKWDLKEDGMIALMDGLMMNKTIRILDLACNQLAGGDGMKNLGVYLAHNKNLKHLILNHNHLKDPGILNLVEHIKKSNIVSLNIAHNDITWIGLDPLLEAIPETRIYALYLWGNAFGVETWKLFKDLLDTGIIRYSDTLVQQVDEETFCIVKNTQVRDVNEYYEAPPIREGLSVPPYMKDAVYARDYEDSDEE